MILRRHLLPNEPDDKVSLARAIWLAEYIYQRDTNSTHQGIVNAFNGT